MTTFSAPNYLATDGRFELEVVAADPVLAPYLTFTDRASYLAWVAEWKAAYRELTLSQRAAKAACRLAEREHSLNQPLSAGAAEGYRYQIADNRERAHVLLALRRAGKQRSAARRDAARTAPVEA